MNTCDVTVGCNVFGDVRRLVDLGEYSKIAIITDENIVQCWLGALNHAIQRQTLDIILSAGECQKNIMTVREISAKLLKNGFDRKSLVINLGGGVVSDIGGFVASCYMRGIDFINVPTTVLAQIDASIGGKVGINLEGVKNIIGLFVQPAGVVSDVATLYTIPDREFISGFAEAIKHGLIMSEEYLRLVVSKKPTTFSQEELVNIIRGSVEIKLGIIKKDEREGGLRKILNFGHTIGHAIESVSSQTQWRLLHGEAVAIGMVGAAKISEIQGRISSDEFEMIESMITGCGLPHRFHGKHFIGTVIEMIKMDKKNANREVKWTLLEGIGKASFDNNVTEDTVNIALRYITGG